MNILEAKFYIYEKSFYVFKTLPVENTNIADVFNLTNRGLLFGEICCAFPRLVSGGKCVWSFIEENIWP